MKINIKSTNMKLTDAVESYLEKKLMMLDKLVEFDRDNVLVQAELGKISKHHRSGEIFRAEVNLRVGRNNYRAVSEKEDIYAAIDDVKDELSREVKTQKNKKVSSVRRGAQSMKKMLRSNSSKNNLQNNIQNDSD